MNDAVETPSHQPSLRLWPAIALIALFWPLRLLAPLLSEEFTVYGLLGGAGFGLLLILWWLFFSGAAWIERIGGVVVMVGSIALAQRLLHVSVAEAGMGFLFPIYALPVVTSALVVWAVLARDMPTGARRVALVATLVVASLSFTLLRTDGMFGAAGAQFTWRWTPTAEERLLALGDDAPTSAAAPATVALSDSGAGWPGFRGPLRDGIVRGVRIDTDWSAAPPTELWRRPIGPGWSSFAVRGDTVFTQEQRGDDEVVAAYSLSTGQPVWMHRDAARFWESNGGAGPRGTPTVRGDRVYAFGATGLLNVLDAETGALVWSRDVGADAGVAVPGWGFASSPLVVGGIVVVAASARLVGYDASSGELSWLGPEARGGYSSPHLLELDGVRQIVLMGGVGVTGVDPRDGSVLWTHEWPAGVRIVQPALTPDGDLLISGGERTGMRRISVRQSSAGWTVTERWTTNRMKPYFSDFVIHEGHVYGFDGSILAAIDIDTGERVWKGGRYGSGQLVLLPDQDVLLVVAEDGELALVEARPEGFSERARVPAMEGKTWNHPVLIGDLLLVRNGQEMVAYRVALLD